MSRPIKYVMYALLISGLLAPLSFASAGGTAPPAGSTPSGAPSDAPPPPPHHPIPKEAIDACQGKAMGGSCSFTGHRNNAIDGTCRTPPRAQGQMVCVPNPPPQAFDACKGKNVGDACSFSGRINNSVNGTCKNRPQGLVCARLKPNAGAPSNAPAGDEPPPPGPG